MAQRRPLSDWLLPDWYFKFLYSHSADWVFVFVAVTRGDHNDQIGRIDGEVLLLERTAWEALRYETGRDPYILSEIFTHELRTWASTGRTSPDKDILPEISLHYLRKHSIFSWIVGIRRSGALWLRLKSSSCAIAFADDYTGSFRQPDESDMKYVANQVFFFLKDISHAHRHHPPGSDTITEVSPLDRKHTWVIETHYRIHRKIVEMRRSKDPKILFHASGMLAYLSAMRRAVEREFGLLPPVDNKPTSPQDGQRHQYLRALTYNNSEIENSIKSSIEVIKWSQTQKNIIKTALPALLLTFLSFSAGDGKGPGAFVRTFVSDFFAKHPGQTIGIVVLALPFAPIYYGTYDIYRIPPVLRAKRILAATTVKRQVIFWFTGAILLFIISGGLLLEAQIMKSTSVPWLRQHPRAWSWATVAIGVGFAACSLYALPFWSTRRDLIAKFRRK